MKLKINAKLVIILVFLLMLILPIVNINLVSGKLSENENRVLAPFPTIVTEEGIINPQIKTDFEDWLDDNIGFRDFFLDIAANIKVKLFRQSTSERVHIGLDGWYYYTPDYNLEIAKGTYPLSDEQLQEIANKQQMISDYYASIGIEYVLALTPSKASIYPEYIGEIDEIVNKTPCDILEAYLREHTDVKVINIKPANLEGKSTGQQFLKTDTHWTELGAYTAYQAIFEGLKEYGIVNGEPVTVEVGEKQIYGEFSSMLGSPGVLGKETTSDITWNQSSSMVEDGTWFEELEAVRKANTDSKNYETVALKNENKQHNLLIYGDSQWMVVRNLPQLLSENFGTVVSTRLRSPNLDMDNAVQPDVILFGCSERFINSVLTRDLTVPMLTDALSDLPEHSSQTSDEWIGSFGNCIEKLNDDTVKNAAVLTVDSDVEQITLQGWSIDFQNEQPLSGLYLKVGDYVLECAYGIKRPSVEEYFKNQNYENVGFKVSFPSSYLTENGSTALQFIQISADGTYRYQPICYEIVRS